MSCIQMQSLVSRRWSKYRIQHSPDKLLIFCSIVAVHGLNGEAINTWKHKTEKIWLLDFLPSDLRNPRIMTFGYNSRVAFCKSKANIEQHARMLLNKLNEMRGKKVFRYLQRRRRDLI